MCLQQPSFTAVMAVYLLHHDQWFYRGHVEDDSIVIALASPVLCWMNVASPIGKTLYITYMVKMFQDYLLEEFSELFEPFDDIIPFGGAGSIGSLQNTEKEKSQNWNENKEFVKTVRMFNNRFAFSMKSYSLKCACKIMCFSLETKTTKQYWYLFCLHHFLGW